MWQWIFWNSISQRAKSETAVFQARLPSCANHELTMYLWTGSPAEVSVPSLYKGGDTEIEDSSAWVRPATGTLFHARMGPIIVFVFVLVGLCFIVWSFQRLKGKIRAWLSITLLLGSQMKSASLVYVLWRFESNAENDHKNSQAQ